MDVSKIYIFDGARAVDLMPIFADVETYPSFVPGYKSAKVVERDGCTYKTKSVMALQFGIFTLEEELDSANDELTLVEFD